MTDRTIDFRYAPRISWTSIARPDDPHKTLVGQDGALLYGFEYLFGDWLFHRHFRFYLVNGGAPISISQRSESPDSSIVETVMAHSNATLTLRAFGHQHDGERRTDVVLWRIEPAKGVSRWQTGLGIIAGDTRGRFILRGFDKSSHFLDYVRNDDVPEDPWCVGMHKRLKEGAKILPALSAWPHDLIHHQAKPDYAAVGLQHGAGEYSHGDAPEGALLIPLNHDEVEDFNWDWARSALDNERRFWAGVELQKKKLVVPDRGVMHMIQASARNILQARARTEDGVYEFRVGACFYRGLWVVDGHFMLEAARYLGYEDEANQGITALTRRAREDGSIEIVPGHTKETGISLATMTRYAELSGDWEGLRRHWPIARRAFEHILKLRRQVCELAPDEPAYRLMPPSFGDGGLGGGRVEFTTPLWVMVGLKHIARAARHLGLESDAADMEAAFSELRQDFLSRAATALRTLPDGLPYLPMWLTGGDHMHGWEVEPIPNEMHLTPASGTWAFCQAIWPGELFAPDDPLVASFLELLDRIDDEEGIPQETGWLPCKALWGYYASFAAHVWLYAGRPDKAIDYLYAFANHAAPTRVWREEQALKSAQHDTWWGDMPHNWASGEFIRMVRHFLIMERFDGLDLLLGLPREWLVPGQPIIVDPSATRFGPVGLHAKLDGSGVLRIEVTLTTKWPERAKQVRLHLPRGIATESATLNGQACAPDGRVLLLDSSRSRHLVEARLQN